LLGSFISDKPLKERWWLGPVVVYFCMLATMLLFMLLFMLLGIRGAGPTVFEQWITYAIPLAIVYLHVRRFERRRKFWGFVGVHKKNLRESFIWLFALWVVFTGILIAYWWAATRATGVDAQEEVSKHFEENFPDWYFGYMFFASFVPVALVEELIFRGFTLDRFLARGPAFAIIASSLMFSSLHLWYAGFGPAVGMSLYGGVFLLAVYWGIVYWKTRNIVGLVVFHGLYNFTLSASHFFGAQAEVVMSAAMFAIGVVCLGYLIIKYIGGLFREIEALVKGVGKSRSSSLR